MADSSPIGVSQEGFAQREPLTTRLRGLVRSYPKGVGLVQEFLQNADDAGARTIRFFLDERSFPIDRLPVNTMARLQGPALVVTNDMPFTERDWDAIQRIGRSDKELDTTKTGRFGLGFNSVYNVTDFPTIVTGTRIGIFDPHGDTVAGASIATPGSAWRLGEQFWSQYADLAAPFHDFGLPRGSHQVGGTVFRLPLRTPQQAERSEISTQPFTAQDFDHIVDKLRGQLADLLLFLKNVQDIELARIDSNGVVHPLLSAKTVNRDVVDGARQRIRDMLAFEHSHLLDLLAVSSDTTAVSEFEHEIEIVEFSGPPARAHFLVVHGLFSDTNGQVVVCAKRMAKLGEKAVPLAGAAARLNNDKKSTPTGRLFCGLPLPLASPVPSCHVNGFFDLQADRQGLFQDPGAEGSAAVRVEWNRLLVEHCCSEAVARLCLRLSNAAKGSAAPLYEHWPRVPAKELSLIDRLPRLVYGRLCAYECVAAGGQSTWRHPKGVLLLASSATEGVQTALLADSFFLPNPALPGFVAAGFAAAGSPITALTPVLLRSSLRVASELNVPIESAPRACLREPEWVAALLAFCLSDDKVDDLLGVPLAYMSDGNLRAFGRNAKSSICLGGPDERALFKRMTGWFIHPSLEAVMPPKDSKPAGVLRLTPALVVANLSKPLPPPGADGRIEVAAAGDKAPSETWLALAFDYMARHAKGITLDKDAIQKLPLVPDQFGYLHGMGTANTPLLPAADESKSFVNALTAAHVPLVSGGEKLMKAVRTFVEAFPDLAVWRVSPRDLIDTLSAGVPDDSHSPVVDDKGHMAAILDYLGSPRAVKDLKGPIADRVDKLKSLRLFPSASGEIVSLVEGDPHVPADYQLPRVNTEIGMLDCGRTGRWLPLYQALNVPRLTRARLLTEIILPRTDDLSAEDIHEVLLWLRHNLHEIKEEESKDAADALLSRIGEALPIRCTDGDCRPCCLLYHPDAKFVASLLGEGIGFPSLLVYNDRADLWLELFGAFGMARTPRADDVLVAIDRLLESDQPVDRKAARLTDIAEYLDQHWDQFKDQVVSSDPLRPSNASSWHISDGLSSRAWLPALQTAPREYPRELLASASKHFYKPSELLVRGALDLAGSVRPVCQTFRLFHMQAGIGLQGDPSLEDVLTHLENLVSLATVQPGPVPERAAPLFRRVYEFLGRAFASDQPNAIETDSRIETLRERFASRPCVIDADRRLWLPEQCFEESVSSFLGRRARVRSENASVERGLTVLGRRPRPVASDYVGLFQELADAHGVIPVPESDRTLLRGAYYAAVLLGDDDAFRNSPVLLDSGTLADSAEAVLDDAPWLSDRARAAGMMFLDPQLGESTAKAFGLRLLSSAVYERPEQELPTHAPQFIVECGVLESRLRSVQLQAGVHRLLAASGIAVRVPALKMFFQALRVMPVGELQTILVWTDGDVPVEGSYGDCDVVFDPRRNGVVVSEGAQEVLYERIASVLGNELRADGHDLGTSAGHFVSILRVDPSSIERLLTKLHVRALPIPTEDVVRVDADDGDGFIDSPADEQPSSTTAESGADTPGERSEKDSSPPTSAHDASGTRHSPPHKQADNVVKGNGEAATEPSGDGDSGVTAPAPTSGAPHLPAGPQSGNGVLDPLTPRTTRTGPRTGPGGGSEEQADRSAGGSPPGAGESGTAGGAPSGHSRPASNQPRLQRGRARTYVTPGIEAKEEEHPERQERRKKVDQAAVQRVLQFEKDNGRHPQEMPHSNEGYDIESFGPSGQIERLIEVKGLSGGWTEFGVPVSRSQFRRATTEGPRFWLYVVEFALEPNRARVYAIQDPEELVDEYWFDGGWREFSTERGGHLPNSAPKQGSVVMVDGSRRGTVKNIQKRGVLMHLDIEFADATREQVVYTPRRVQTLPDEEAQA